MPVLCNQQRRQHLAPLPAAAHLPPAQTDAAMLAKDWVAPAQGPPQQTHASFALSGSRRSARQDSRADLHWAVAHTPTIKQAHRCLEPEVGFTLMQHRLEFKLPRWFIVHVAQHLSLHIHLLTSGPGRSPGRSQRNEPRYRVKHTHTCMYSQGREA